MPHINVSHIHTSRLNIRHSGLLASCMLLGLLAFSPARAEDMGTLTPTDARPFPDLGYKDAQGRAHSLKEEKNALTMVHFWATWCVPCVEEFPQVDALQAAYGAKGLKIIAISMDGEHNQNKVQKFFTSHQVSHLTPYFDSGTAAFVASKARGIPTSFFLDAKGQEVGIAEGPIDWSSADAKKFIESRLQPITSAKQE